VKRLLIVVTLTLAFTAGAFAQLADDTPATKEDVQRYFQVMRVHDMMNQMIDAMAKPMHQMVHDMYTKDQDKLPPDFEERMNKMMDGMFRDIPWDQMIDAMVPAYQKHLTKGDLDAVIAFYSTPAGQKLRKEMPAMTAESMQAMMPIMEDYMQKVQGRIQEQATAMLKESEKKQNQEVKN
jgi:uncharacterized protein